MTVGVIVIAWGACVLVFCRGTVRVVGLVSATLGTTKTETGGGSFCIF